MSEPAIETASQRRTRMMLEEPVQRVIPRLAVPTIISMLISSIYNMADTYFVSQLGTSASGAVGVIFSAMSIIQAIAFMFGMGSGTNVSHALGAKDEKLASQFVATGFFSAFGAGVIIAILGNLCLDPLVRFLGATETIAPYARDYAAYIFYGAPFMMCSLAMNNLLRFEGLAAYGMVGVTSGGLLNIVLDPILIFGLKLGTAGAAIATAVSQLVSFTILLLMTNRRASAISISWKNFTPTAVIYKKMLGNGFPSLARQGIASVSTILLNTTAGAWGDAAIAAMSIVSRYLMFINSSIIGFGQGFQPVCGFCYGAGKYSRVRQAYTYCIRVGTVVLLVLGAISFVFAEPIITLFRRDDLEVIRIGTTALQLQLLSLPLWAFITLSNMCTQAMGLGMKATLISIARQGIFLIPALLILPRVFGLLGLQMAQPIADLCTAIFAFFIVHKVMQELKNRPDVV